MEIMYLVLCLLCVGVITVTTFKNSKLLKETDLAKKEYLTAKSTNLRLEQNFNEAMYLFKETRNINKMLIQDMNKCKVEINTLKYTVHTQSGLIEEQEHCITELRTRVTTLEYDNKRLKQKLNIHDEVARRSKVVVPFKATI